MSKLRTAALATCALALAALTACTAPPAASPAPSAPPTATTTPQLPAGELEVVYQAPQLADVDRSTSPILQPGISVSEKWIAVVSPPDGTLTVFDRATLEEAWSASGGPTDWGPCDAPYFLSEERLVLLTGIEGGGPCSRFVVYDLESGEAVDGFEFVTAEYQGTKSYEQVTGTAAVDGRLWFVTSFHGLGFLDPKTAEPEGVLDSAELGAFTDDQGGRAHVSSLAVDPESGLLVTTLLHGELIGDAPAADVYGIRVDGAEAEVVWKFGDTIDGNATLGVGELDAADPFLVVDDREPGALAIAELADGSAVLGRLDPETGRMPAPISPTTPVEFAAGLADGHGAYEVVGDLLVTGATGPDGGSLDVVGYDLVTGQERWRTTPPAPFTATVQDVSVGTDGQLYALSIGLVNGDAALNRIDRETGESTETWQIPSGLFGETGVTARVVDEAVVLAFESNQTIAFPTSPLVILAAPQRD
ncbi:PQQ-binding-like beta-propeller repeat protein [Agromyces soli]|uniref:PQQ-binding-like beta-propeller repeat protein n=1 Tax=Agromyces soli TaxID=659012 RepID=A0ABY4AX15_9MICO|nr:PQQ-binding-like beta-propeller repeat protein [Agromyces soli]UOE27730.1 PQQ-binding-like beta-propeller repeat protein [Agromyces soli]